MAVIQGVKEKVHLPLYDSINVKPEEQLRKDQGSSTLKFFVDVQGKTKLETNMQSASQLSHYNTYEARAMRVVISDLPPEFPEEPTASDSDYDVDDGSDNENPFFLDANGRIGAINPTTNATVPFEFEAGFVGTITTARRIVADVEIGLDRIVELLHEASDSEDGFAALFPTDDEVTLRALALPAAGAAPALAEVELSDLQSETLEGFGGTIWLAIEDLEFLIDELPEREAPPRFQIEPNNGAGTLISKFIYNTVTTFFVGEKTMIEAPTWMFPAGAGAFSDQAAITTHGIPSPMDTFRFAEPIFIDKQQNFRVEIEIPDSDTLKDLQKLYGPLFIWVVLDGYMTRDVQ